MNLHNTNKTGYVLITLLGVLSYCNTLDIPWYYDDYRVILENATVKNFMLALQEAYKPRGIANLTFSINYYFSQGNPAFYHLLNIALHLSAANLIYTIFLKFYRSKPIIPLISAAVFAVHPVQTQAVNYIVQRSTLLAALFTLLAIYFYIHSRRNQDSEDHDHGLYLTYGLSLFFGFLAVHTKQNTATLPILLLLTDYFLISREKFNWKKTTAFILPFCVIPIVIAIPMVLTPLFSEGETLATIGGTRHLSNLGSISPLHYFATELQVFFIYFRLIFIPVHLTLDYSFPIATDILTAKTLLSFLVIAGVLFGAYKTRKKLPELSFGIFWFFAALLVESTFIPLDPIFEHRLYLPIIGPIFSITYYSCRIESRKMPLSILVVIILIFTVMSLQRNNLWRDPVAFMEDNVRKVPDSEGVLVALSGRYLQTGRYDDAIRTLTRAQQINPNFTDIYSNLSSALIQKNDLEQALSVTHRGLKRDPNDIKLLNNLGLIYTYLKKPVLALQILEPISEKEPYNYKTKLMIGKNLLDINKPGRAKTYLIQAKNLSRNDPRPHYFLGVAFYHLGELHSALEEMETALKLSPSDPQTIFSVGIVSHELGNRQKSKMALEKLQKYSPTKAEKLQKIIQTVQ